MIPAGSRRKHVSKETHISTSWSGCWASEMIMRCQLQGGQSVVDEKS